MTTRARRCSIEGVAIVYGSDEPLKAWNRPTSKYPDWWRASPTQPDRMRRPRADGGRRGAARARHARHLRRGEIRAKRSIESHYDGRARGRATSSASRPAASGRTSARPPRTRINGAGTPGMPKRSGGRISCTAGSIALNVPVRARPSPLPGYTPPCGSGSSPSTSAPRWPRAGCTWR